jgi:hypothetical protein
MIGPIVNSLPTDSNVVQVCAPLVLAYETWTVSILEVFIHASAISKVTEVPFFLTIETGFMS